MCSLCVCVCTPAHVHFSTDRIMSFMEGQLCRLTPAGLSVEGESQGTAGFPSVYDALKQPLGNGQEWPQVTWSQNPQQNKQPKWGVSPSPPPPEDSSS